MAQNSLKITKWGNGQGVRLPKAVMNLLSLKTGDELQMTIEDEKITLVPKKEKKVTFAQRFESYSGPTEQEEIWTDDLIGKEVL